MRARPRIAALMMGSALVLTTAGGATSGTRPGAGCAWPLKLNPDTFNFAYPDSSATYWGAHLPFVPGARLVVKGTYPFARYFSFHAYDEAQRPVDSIADHEIAPDRGSTNPYSAPAAQDVPASPGRRAYTAYVDFGAPPAKPERNTIYAGAMRNGHPNPAGFILYRVYTPDDPASPEGSVPLPELTLEGAGGAVAVPLDRCEPLPPGASGGINEAIRDRSYPDETGRNSDHPAATDPPTFKRFYGTDQFPRDFTGGAGDRRAEAESQGGFLSNEQIAYLYAYLSRQYGDVLVMRGRAPSFPDTRAGEPPTARRDVRYWSICQNNGLSQRMTDCAADHQTPVGSDGYFTVVVSDPDDRPSNAVAADGVTWIAWGGLYYEGLLIYRHMLPARQFDEAIQKVPENEDPLATMGDFYPVAGYCEKEDFEAGGWRACIDG